jgi:hypothetical protein
MQGGREVLEEGGTKSSAGQGSSLVFVKLRSGLGAGPLVGSTTLGAEHGSPLLPVMPGISRIGRVNGDCGMAISACRDGSILGSKALEASASVSLFILARLTLPLFALLGSCRAGRLS